MKTRINCKLTKAEARKILAECRIDNKWDIEDCLEKLNSGEYSEIPLRSYAKIIGRNRNYSIMYYAEDASDALFPMTVIGRVCPLPRETFGQSNSSIMAYDRYGDGGEVWMFRFDNGYIAKVIWNMYDRTARIQLMAINRKTKKPAILKDHWNNDNCKLSWDGVPQGLEAIKRMPAITNG